MIATQLAAVIRAIGQMVTLRKTTSVFDPTSGVNAVNPASTSALMVMGAASAGATTINLDAAAVTGRLIAGDSFTIAGDATVYSLDAAVNANANAFAGVTFTPALALAAADNAAVTVSFTADHPVKAAVRAYKPEEIVGLVQQGDRQVRIAANDLDLTPARLDKLIISGNEFTIEHVETRAVRGVDALHILQVRG